MQPLRNPTKRERRLLAKFKLGSLLVILGLSMMAGSLFYLRYLEQLPKPISPLSKNQVTSNLSIEKKLKEKKISFVSIETSKDLSYKIVLNSKSEVIIDPNKNIDQQLSSLQLIITQLKIEGKAFHRLDFRYQKPIIAF